MEKRLSSHMLPALTLGWAVIYANRTCLYPLLSVIAADLSLSSTRAGTITSVYFILYVLMQIPAGILGDKWGLKNVLMTFFSISILGILGLGLFGASYNALLIFTALHGLGAGAFYPAAYGTLLQVVDESKRGFSSSVIGIGMALGLILGLAAAGPLYEMSGSYRIPFLVMALPSALALVYIYFTLPNVRGQSRITWSQYKTILSDKDLWLINLATFTVLYGFWVAMSWGPTYLKVERNFSLGQSGMYTGLVALSAIPAALLWGRLSDIWGRKKVALFLLPCGALSLYGLSLAQGRITIILGFLLYGMFCNSSFTPVMVAWTADLVNRRYPGCMGAAVGVFNCVIMFSAIVAPVVSGYLRDLTGSLLTAIHLGVVLMLGGVLLLFFLPGSSGHFFRKNIDKRPEA